MKTRRLLILLPALFFAGLAVLLWMRLYAGDPSRLPSALIGHEAPDFDLPAMAGLTTSDGKPVPGLARADLGHGRVTVVNVWASWCVPCRAEHPFLLRLSQMDRVRLVGINYKDDPENALRFLGELGNPFAAVGVDAKGRAAIDWGVYGVPETFIVDGKGRIAYKQVGPINETILTETILPEIDKAERGTATASR